MQFQFQLKHLAPIVSGTVRKSGRLRSLISASTEKTVCQVHDSTTEMVDEAVAAGRDYLESDTTLNGGQRRDLLNSIALKMEQNRDELAYLETIQGGKTIRDSLFDVDESIECFKYYAGLADKLYGTTLDLYDLTGGKIDGSGRSKLSSRSQYHPVGVCGLITSYNYPLILTSWKLAPALCCGNSVLIKPHQLTPLSALFMGDLIQQVLGEGNRDMVHVLPGGADIGAAICQHMDVDKVSFTGSGGVGRLIQKQAADSNFKRVTLELGGKSPLIVFEDAFHGRSQWEKQKVVNDIASAIFANAGQNCCAGSRLFIHEAVYDEVVERLVKAAGGLAIGDPVKQGTDIGPIVDQIQLEKIMKIVDKVKSSGSAEILTGGSRHGSKGYFIKPTVVQVEDDNHFVARQEIFGPVLTVLPPFKTEQEVVRRANDSEYGLAAGLWTRDADRIQRMQRQIKAGTLWINCYNYIHPSNSFGGLKQSGYGHDLGMQSSLTEWTQPRVTYQSYSLQQQ
ncbi:hypothetical protein MIR68_000708 [Amoeboaphelidium protococcarum]|nr:hypothetical protein MIR68_000708 [Amoeboaphelidium protococcarum]